MNKLVLMNLALLCAISVFGQTQKKRATTPIKKPATTTSQKPGVQQAAKPQRPKLAIEYFAEYNLFNDEIGNSNDNDKSSYYNFDEAQQVSPEGWHLPTQEEWAGIFPYSNWRLHGIEEGIEPITINGVTKNYFAEYKTVGNVTYAIRFKRDPEMELDNKLLSAYRYETINKDDKLKIRQTVTVLYLGPAFHGTIDNIANESYWQTYKNDAIVREFPFAGALCQVCSGPASYGFDGKYWSSSTPATVDFYGCPRTVELYTTWATGAISTWGCQYENIMSKSIKPYRFSVRCILNKQ